MRRLGALMRSVTVATIFAVALPLSADEPSARSADGRWRLQADPGAHALRIIDVQAGTVIDRIDITDRRGVPSAIAGILEAPPRRSFIVLLRDVAEAWELVYAPGAERAFDGLVHDYRMGEAIAQRFVWPLRRIVLDEPQQEFLFAPDFAHGIARARDGSLHVVNLHVRRRIETLRVEGEPVIGAGISWVDAHGTVFALPDARLPIVHVIDAQRWRVGRVELSGVSPALRSEGGRIWIEAGGVHRFWQSNELRRAAGF